MGPNVLSTRIALVAALAVAGLAALSADQLVLRSGRRISGELIAFRNGVIEFREGGVLGSRVVRVPRDEVRRIELDDEDVYADERGGQGVARDRALDRDDIVGGRPRGLRERGIIVSGDVAWNDTGVTVRAGQTVYFTARGTVWWGPNRKNGPDGERDSPYNPARPIPNRPAASLIGRIGDEPGDYFFIGSEEGPMRMRASGRLYLGVNDDVLRDNHGNFQVTVFY